MSMGKSLLIGNGLNRSLSNSIAWSNILKEVADEYHVEYNADIPMPLEFERIVNKILSVHINPSKDLYLEIKKKVADKLKNVQLPQDALHYDLHNLELDAILTTNYDFLLEYVYNQGFEYKGENKKYLFSPTSIQQNVKFYHLHGMISDPNSICLGYEHYIGLVQKLRQELNTKKGNIQEQMAKRQVLLNLEPPRDTWGERFYTSDIYILGLGLAHCETDLWWLLTHRAYLYYSDYCGLRKHIKNKILYFDIVNDIKKTVLDDEIKRYKQEIEQKNKHLLLEANHVQVVTCKLSLFDGSYTDAYRSIIQQISNGEN